eukprot:TRINITY_DN4090_c0_g1_i4.p1 TRINITY_DN4090_c0_g1~~TRINITY_DN4090_c0_g1_i4.p1  ORF type:complete len:1144 (-),score=254.36 TRINITY_DN4090_c0_g1_i4:279-3710(-)
MLVKFETKSNRVKGLSFHNKRPWILASLHNGVIQLWDYRMGTLLDKFEEHEGPVRGVNFHMSQPLFVSGGDDSKVKVWNYKLRRCLFTLQNHLDYIRTVQFHHEWPWIISCSDDQTIRIWNWQSRTCQAVLTGHSHYVMSAFFHPKDDLVVSASLDQTIRVWDISGLKKKKASPLDEAASRLPQINSDLFGGNEAIVKYVLEGHDRGVNWASFHPTMPLIVSGADDRQIKLWRMNETKAWEVDTMRGHYHNVSCVLFHPRQDIIISNSEDKSIRVWDMSKRTCIQTYRRENDRFWVMASHPEMNLFATGHDSGMMVFKLERERPLYSVYGTAIYYLKDRLLRVMDLSSRQDTVIGTVKRGTGNVRGISFNPTENVILASLDADGGSYEIFNIPKDSNGQRQDVQIETRRGQGVGSVFMARNRFAVLDKSHSILVKNFKNEVTKKIEVPQNVDQMFYAGAGFVLLKGDDQLILFDVQQKKSVGEIAVQGVKYVYWSDDMSYAALVSKHVITIVNRKLDIVSNVHETIRIKSGIWDDNNVFIYTTLSHMKYLLPWGDGGVIRTIEAPLYLLKAKGDNVFCIDREYRFRALIIQRTEYMFKHALHYRRYDEVLHIIKNSKLHGQAIIAYLQKKGFPEVALYFVKDDRVRINLALECGNIEVALESAKKLDDKDAWNRLGAESLKQGNHQVVEMAYQRTKNFESLSFLYLITGNMVNLSKMLKISKMRNDVMSRFHNALYLGDISERVAILAEAGLLPLAYTLARISGLEQETQMLSQHLPEVPENIIRHDPKCILPPIPILHDSNWPLLTVSKGYFDGPTPDSSSHVAAASSSIQYTEEEEGEAGAWGEDLKIGDDGVEEGAVTEATGDGEEGWEEDLQLPDVQIASNAAAPGGAKSGAFAMPSGGNSFGQVWCQNSALAVDHAAAGSVETAMQLLNKQLGIIDFAPLKPYFVMSYTAATSQLGGIGSTPLIGFPMHRNWSEAGKHGGVPAVPFTLLSLVEKLKSSYTLVTGGKFSEAMSTFMQIIHTLPFIIATNKQEANEARELLGICREYITGIKLEMARKEATDPIRQSELAAYFTHCNLQPVHLSLSLRSAMNCHFKVKNNATAAAFARRLLELNPKPEVATTARKVLQLAEQANFSQDQV